MGLHQKESNRAYGAVFFMHHLGNQKLKKLNAGAGF